MTGPRILLVEDDESIGRSLAAALRTGGNLVGLATTGEQAIVSAKQQRPDLVLVDLGLPDMDGVDVIREIRASARDTVVVVLTARLDEADVLVALDAGADDYLTKPFRLAELLARIQAHLRRARPAQSGDLAGHGVRVDQASRRVFVGGEEVSLRPREYDLLCELMRHTGEAVSREDLMARVWDEHWFGSTKTLDIHISGLRARLLEAGVEGSPISTLRGFGYRWD